MLNGTKVAIIINKIIGLIQLIIGYFFAIIFGITCVMEIFDKKNEISTFIGTFVLFLLSVALILAGNKRRKSVREFRKYVGYLSDDPTGSIANMAAAMGNTQAEIIKKLEYMIEKKYFSNAYINKETNCIIIDNVWYVDNLDSINEGQGVIDDRNIIIKCKNCGGTNKKGKGNMHECDYCGSPIK